MKKAVQVKMILSIFVLVGLLFVPAINNVWGAEVVKYVTLKVDGMTCASCPATVKAALKRLPGVIRADVSYKGANATVSYYEGKVTVEQMIKAIEDVGYTAHLITEEGKQ